MKTPKKTDPAAEAKLVAAISQELDLARCLEEAEAEVKSLRRYIRERTGDLSHALAKADSRLANFLAAEGQPECVCAAAVKSYEKAWRVEREMQREVLLDGETLEQLVSETPTPTPTSSNVLSLFGYPTKLNEQTERKHQND